MRKSAIRERSELEGGTRVYAGVCDGVERENRPIRKITSREKLGPEEENHDKREVRTGSRKKNTRRRVCNQV